MYLVKTPWWLKKIYPGLTWNIPSEEKVLYLTFDDGPHPVATPFVLDTLRIFDAIGTFFCIGKNVRSQREIYNRILQDGHKVGNHTNNHLNGWKTADKLYMDDIYEAKKIIDSNLFRPPYGRITNFQAKHLKPPFKIVMWDVLSADFDIKITPKKALENVIAHSGPGSIIVFHDSGKAFPRLEYALPKALDFFKQKGYQFRPVPL